MRNRSGHNTEGSENGLEIIRQNTVVPYDKTAVVLGNFDGLHIAHAAIINSGIDYAKRHNLKSGVLLFEENTKSVTDGRKIKLITDNAEKLRLLDKMGVDFAYMIRFDREFMKKTPDEFVLELAKFLKPKAVFAGYDYRFGYKAEGDVTALIRLAEKYGFKAEIIPEIESDGRAVSSTLIRSLIETGDIKSANKLLGRPFEMYGTVERGLQNGRKMGFPTANLSYDENLVLPHTGVYAGFTYFDGNRHKSVVNVGNNPTFGADRITIESHIFDFDKDIYDENIRIAFIEKIRGDVKFDGIDKLKAQIANDAQRANIILEGKE